MRRFLLIPLTAALLALTPAMAGSAAVPPQGFIGISPQGATGEEDYELMALAGIKSVRLPMNWQDIVPEASERFDPDWALFDDQVRLAAEQRIRAFPFLWGTPEWVSHRLGAEPVASARQRREWLRFLREAVERYGPDGELLAREPRRAAPARPPVGDLERGEHRHLLPRTRSDDASPG